MTTEDKATHKDLEFEDGCIVWYTRYNVDTWGYTNTVKDCPSMSAHIKKYNNKMGLVVPEFKDLK